MAHKTRTALEVFILIVITGLLSAIFFPKFAAPLPEKEKSPVAQDSAIAERVNHKLIYVGPYQYMNQK